ncbi:ABSCISIC ACID-INSENSITIVE 5-like protein 4 isoform X2 [Magnolia sinica]|uniref:ABSCISIC ACID-INSENSITIVE 5-like protein 4 isoform X2 n=1 Tax=Magnolia sinica TaxID=86752 RepID=UPI0026597F6A|nr:ABSCISIC ACID-INSENSITIVE 5-like protein 4 isoform X2 [Magnolia sinica]
MVMASPSESLHTYSAASTAAATAAAPSDNRSSPHRTVPISRQSSIYSVTLDEFQQSVDDARKSFGSMSMDEFLLSIWTAEETATGAAPSGETTAAIAQPSLAREGSSGGKTVGDVWSEIQPRNSCNVEIARGEQIFGGMTLEDFLLKAGVVSEGCGPSRSPHYLNFRNSGVADGYGQYWDSGGAVGHGDLVGPGSPLSPASSDGCGPSRGVDDSVSHHGLRRGGGRKRIVDVCGPFDQGVDRRQRRMIKNRESAARSRARRQAYTMELEAELNQLKEENALIRKETLSEPSQEKPEAEKEGKTLRRTSSWPR